MKFEYDLKIINNINLNDKEVYANIHDHCI